MKIKDVCELTKLSDRTIRYYIEQGLITPSYTENYLGRKAYSFFQKDINELNNIATLRKFDFTIDEIRNIITSPENSKNIIENVKLRTRKAAEENEEKLSVLVQLDNEKAYTISELAKQLTIYSEKIPVQNEDTRKSFRETLFGILKTILVFIIVWLPVLLLFSLSIIASFSAYAYPCFNTNPLYYICLFACLLPSISVLIISKLKFTFKKPVKLIALALCVLSIPFSILLPLGLVTQSETTDFSNYRDFDVHCIANQDIFFQELFPVWPNTFESVEDGEGNLKTVYLDAHYYYRYYAEFDYTYDVYAEWPLEKDEFDEEVARVKELFEKYSKTDDYLLDENRSIHTIEGYTTIKKGNYTCLFYGSSYANDEPFSKATDNYEYDIFAYDEKNLKVRYISCASLENGADQPYYLQLDW